VSGPGAQPDFERSPANPITGSNAIPANAETIARAIALARKGKW
jgi:hypothetical protein